MNQKKKIIFKGNTSTGLLRHFHSVESQMERRTISVWSNQYNQQARTKTLIFFRLNQLLFHSTKLFLVPPPGLLLLFACIPSAPACQTDFGRLSAVSQFCCIILQNEAKQPGACECEKACFHEVECFLKCKETVQKATTEKNEGIR